MANGETLFYWKDGAKIRNSDKHKCFVSVKQNKRIEMRKNWKFKTGIALIIISTLLFTSLLAVPFLNADGKTKITITTVLIVLGEITFWTGGILLGKELFSKYKAYFNPINWFKKKTVAVSIEDPENRENSVNQPAEF